MNRIELVLVLLFTFFVIVVWVTSDVILAKPITPEDPKLQSMLEPLTPTFDTKTIDQINSLKLEAPIKQERPQPTLAPSATPLASGSANLIQPRIATPAPVATTSANLPFGNNLNTAGTSLNTGTAP